MRQLSLREIQERELAMLRIFADFCQEYKLRYYLCGGSTLGAVRHKGFIPWDDDIDVMMPRPDFERFISLAKERFGHEDYRVEYGDGKESSCIYPYGQIWDLATEIEREYADTNRHLWMDILVVDGLPETMSEIEKLYQRCGQYSKVIQLSKAHLGKGKSAFRKYAKYILKPLASMYGYKRALRKIIALAKQNPYEECGSVGVVTGGLYGAGERMEKTAFEKEVYMEFEGGFYPLPSCWDAYLTGIYGDYMQLPPIEKRKTHKMKVYLSE